MDSFLHQWLTRQFPTAKTTTLKRMVQAGRVRVNGNIVSKLKHALAENDKVEVSDQPNRAPPPMQNLGFGIVHEDAEILVVNKPAGLLTSTVPRERRPTLLAMVREYVSTDPDARVGLIHRLDRDASGLLIFSKSDAAYQVLKHQFFHHTVKREYAAVVMGIPNPPAGRIESQLVEYADGTVHATKLRGKGMQAITDYETVKSAVGKSLLKVTLQTGRKHQIRVHLADMGVPIVGDAVYRSKQAVEQSGRRSPKEDKATSHLLLAAVRLEIDHPQTKKRMNFEIPLPANFGLGD